MKVRGLCLGPVVEKDLGPTEDGGDMAVRKGTGDAESDGQRCQGGIRIASQSRAQRSNLLGGEMGKIGEGAPFDFAVLAIGFVEENGGWGSPGGAVVDLVEYGDSASWQPPGRLQSIHNTARPN